MPSTANSHNIGFSFTRTLLSGALMYKCGALFLTSLLVLYTTQPVAAQVAFNPETVAGWATHLGLWTPIFIIVLIALESLLAPIPGWFLVAGAGMLYGFWGGIALAWTGAMVGAILAFALARRYGRRFLFQRIPDTLMQRLDAISKENGFLILLTARVVPFTALDLLSYAAGLSNISFPSYLAATALGFLPGTVALVATGSQVATMQRIDHVLYVVLAGGIIVGTVKVWLRRAKRRQTNG